MFHDSPPLKKEEQYWQIPKIWQKLIKSATSGTDQTRFTQKADVTWHSQAICHMYAWSLDFTFAFSSTPRHQLAKHSSISMSPSMDCLKYGTPFSRNKKPRPKKYGARYVGDQTAIAVLDCSS